MEKIFGCCRFLYNQHVENFKKPKDKQEKLTEKILREKFEFLKEAPFVCLQETSRDFQKACNNFFRYFKKKTGRKVGSPKFKKKSNEETCRFSNSASKIEENFFVFIKLGRIKFRGSIKEGRLLSITIRKLPSNIYEALVLVETEIQPLPKTGKAIGLDLGINSLIISSEGVKVNNPKWFRKNQARLKKYQRKLSRKKKGSMNRNKSRIKVAKVYRKISNSRSDFIHKITTDLVKNYDVICLEDLNSSGMVKNRNLAKSVSDASFRMIRTFLEYKSLWYDKVIPVIDRFFPSSKTCSECGSIQPELPLDVRSWTCNDCGTEHDRDINAAKNILREGLRIIGQEVSEFTPVEIKTSGPDLYLV